MILFKANVQHSFYALHSRLWVIPTQAGLISHVNTHVQVCSPHLWTRLERYAGLKEYVYSVMHTQAHHADTGVQAPYLHAYVHMLMHSAHKDSVTDYHAVFMSCRQNGKNGKTSCYSCLVEFTYYSKMFTVIASLVVTTKIYIKPKLTFHYYAVH